MVFPPSSLLERQAIEMRRFIALLGLGLFVLALGCNPNGRLNILRNDRDKQPPLSPQEVPTVAALVNYMDENAARIKSLRCSDVGMTVHNGVVAIGAPGQMMCQQPRNFRMKAQGPVLGKEVVDLGSNDQEFWYWISKAEPPRGLNVSPQYHCSYQALQQGKVRFLPFPFQPDWIMETLGMGQYGPATRYEPQVVVEPERLKLVEKTRSPQGQLVRKVTVFNRRKAQGNNPQITDYLLEDESGKVICSAHVTEVQFDKNGGGVVPRRIELSWPEQKLKLGMVLNNVEINPPVPAGAFVRQTPSNIPSFDLASGRPDAQPNSLQRAGGIGYGPR